MGGCEQYLLTALQMIQNRIMRLICRRGRRHPIRELLKETDWLSVRQLVAYHSLVQIRKILTQKKPIYLYNRLVGNNRLPYARRIAPGRDTVIISEPRLRLTESSWRWRSSRLWMSLPEDVRNIQEIKGFKLKLRIWIRSNVEI